MKKFEIKASNATTLQNETLIARRTLRSAMRCAEAYAHDLNTPVVVVLTTENKLIAKVDQFGSVTVY